MSGFDMYLLVATASSLGMSISWQAALVIACQLNKECLQQRLSVYTVTAAATISATASFQQLLALLN